MWEMQLIQIFDILLYQWSGPSIQVLETMQLMRKGNVYTTLPEQKLHKKLYLVAI